MKAFSLDERIKNVDVSGQWSRKKNICFSLGMTEAVSDLQSSHELQAKLTSTPALHSNNAIVQHFFVRRSFIRHPKDRPQQPSISYIDLHSATMSSRAMKKLLRDSNGPTPMKDLETLNNATKNTESEDRQEDHEAEEEEEEDDYIPKRPPARNLFALVIYPSIYALLYCIAYRSRKICAQIIARSVYRR